MADDVSRFGRIIHTFDVYQNMRLNTDHMSYEELLALGERIGKVCTGVPEEKISMCLVVKGFSDHKQERSCVICLEGFKIEDELGVLNNCGHDVFHASCVIEWLLMKKTCPICRHCVLDPPKND